MYDRTPGLLCCAAWMLGACAPDAEPDDEPPTERPATTPISAGTASVRGSVRTPDGEWVVDLSVSLCGAQCNIARSDADGVFDFVGIPAGIKVIEPTIAPVAEDERLQDAVRRWGRFFDFVDVTDGATVQIDEPFVLPPVDTIGPLEGFQELAIAPDLAVSFDADAIVEDGLLPVGADGIWLGAVPVPQERWPRFGLRGWTVHAAWSLAIWDLGAEDVFSVVARLPDALPADADVGFLVADYTYGFIEGHFFEEAAVLGPDGTTLAPPPDGGLDRATLWLAVSRPQ